MTLSSAQPAPAASAPRERRTQAERSEVMRQRLIDATLDCLITEGYTGLTIAKITDKAGVSRGAPLHHFATKSTLVEAAGREIVTRILKKMMAAHRSSVGTADPVEAFGMALWNDIFTAEEGLLLWELTYASRREPELAPVTRDLWQRMYRFTSRSALRYVRSQNPDFPADRVLFLTQWLMRGMAQDVHLGAPPELFQSYLRMWQKMVGTVTENSA